MKRFRLESPKCTRCGLRAARITWPDHFNVLRVPMGLVSAVICGHSLFDFGYKCAGCGEVFLASPTAAHPEGK